PLELLDFKNALEQFQKLVEKIITQKTKERSGLYTKDDDEIDYNKFYTTTRALFGPEIKDHNIQAYFRKIINNFDSSPDWLEIFGCFLEETDGLSSQLKESMVFLVSEKQQVTDSVVKRKDVINGIVKVPHLNFTITASQKGVITIFDNQRLILYYSYVFKIINYSVIGCTISRGSQHVLCTSMNNIWSDIISESNLTNNCFVIKPMKNCLLCVCTVTMSDHLAKDSILMGDDKGHVYLLTMTSDNFILKQYKAGKDSQFHVLDSESFNIVKRKLHDDWVGKVRYISALNRFGSCSSDSISSFVLDNIKRLEDNLPVKEFSVPKGVNAFTYCGKAKVIVTGG
ncbi:WDR64 protein, partial [Calyptomena viridis]|nr:WDR64 protein [Calyptomena viridis]